jgi:hypothetical protein
MILRLLNWQGIAGIGVGLVLSILLVIQKGETGHWKKQSAGFEQLYHQDQAAFAATVANARAAAVAARAADLANAERVTAEQRAINERTNNDFEARLAVARAAAERLRGDAKAHPGAGGSASMPGLSAPAGSAPQAARQDGLPPEDALTATEQAIQLDELIKWVRAQAKVDNNPAAVASRPGD